MPIQVNCPHPACGKVLTIKDEFAGKKCRCSRCGGVILIPIPGTQPPLQEERSPFQFDDPPVETPRPSPLTLPSPPGGEGGVRGKEAAEPAAKEEAEASLPARKLRRRKPRLIDDNQDQEPEGTDGTEAEDNEQRSEGKKENGTVTIVVLQGIGILLLVVVGISPFFKWYALEVRGSAPGFNRKSLREPPPPINLWEGKAILGVSLAVAVLVGIALGASFALKPEMAKNVTAAGCCTAEAWGVVVMLWIFGFTLWWIYKKRFEFESSLQDYSGVTVKALPDVGLMVGILAAVGTCLVFSHVATRIVRKRWIILAQFIGLLAGGLLLVLDVKPW